MSNYFYASQEKVFVRLSSRQIGSQRVVEPLEEDIGDCACSSVFKTEGETEMNQGTDNEISETTLPELEFENREYELGRIANPAGPRFIVVDGPPEYGKTCLLKAVKKQHDDDERLNAKWVCVLLNLADQSYKNNQQAILDEISKQVAKKPTKSGVVSQLAANIAGQEKDVLLLFDTVDRREQETKWLVRDVIPVLVGALRIPNKRLRVVFAGRYISKRWPWPGYNVISLSGFDEPIVQRVIQDLAPHLTSSSTEILAREVTFLSGGHPGSIGKILHNFASRHWAIQLGDDGFLQPSEERKRLFDEHVNPSINFILNHITDKGVRKALKTLSVFRRFNTKTIEALQKRTMISSSLNPLTLPDKLTNTGLLKPPTSCDPFYSDAIVRNLILVQMQFTDVKRYLDLNKFACTLYDAWIEGQDIEGKPLKSNIVDEEQVTFMVESFYHFLYYEERKRSISEIEDKLKSYLQKLKSAFEDSPVAIPSLKRLFANSLRGDLDIQRRLRELIGETETEELLNRVLSQERMVAMPL